MMQVHVIPADWETHREVLSELRGKVFIEEQGVAREIEWDGQDEDAHHFLAINEAGQRLGCARLLPSGQIGCMGVLAEHRHGGICGQLLSLAVEEAARLGFQKLFLNAQTHAEAFYRNHGFLPVGGEFMEAGIAHQRMELVLPIPFEAPEGVGPAEVREEAPHPDAGKAALLQFDGEIQGRAAICATLDSPLRSVCVYSQHLDHKLFDDAEVVSALSRFVRHGPPATLRILLHSSDLLVSRGHRLLELARRLDSKIFVRLVPRELAEDQHSFVVRDSLGYWMQPDFREYQGFSNAYDPVESARLVDRFDYLWERSEEDPELRTLRL